MHPIFSLNLSKMQIVVSILVGIVVLLGAGFGTSSWVKASISKIAAENFKTAADAYYEEVIPERNEYYNQLLRTRLMAFEREISKPIETRLGSLDGRVTVLETQGSNVVKTLDRHETLLLEILRRLPEGNR